MEWLMSAIVSARRDRRGESTRRRGRCEVEAQGKVTGQWPAVQGWRSTGATNSPTPQQSNSEHRR
jgi:hypothetical protein